MKNYQFNIKDLMLRKSKQVANHEAHHAIMYWYGGMILKGLSILPGIHPDGTELDGNIKIELPEAGGECGSISHKLFTVSHALGLMAGRAGTELFCPDIPPISYQHDFKTLESLLSFDEELASMANWRVRNPTATSEDFYQQFKPLIFRVLKSRRGKRCIKALTAALLKHRQLSGRSVVKILEEAWGKPLPSHVLPADQHLPIAPKWEEPQCFADAMNEILVYMSMLKKKILPFRDSEENTPLQNETIQRIADNILQIQFLAIGPLPDGASTEDQPNKPS